jgi:hypothetical protein
MSRALRFAFPVLAAAIAVIVGSSAAFAAVWSSSAQWASWSNAGYTLYNNIWGSGAGPQTIWANSYSNWGVWSDQPSTGGVKSYPNVSRSIGQSLSSLSSVTSSFNLSDPGSGAFEAAYDIWANGSADEIMLWVDTHNVGPLGSYQKTVSIGGSSWNVYRGSNGSNAVFSFVRTSNTTSGSVDIKGTFNWLSSAGWLSGATLSTVQFGWEITSTNNSGENFAVNNYSLSW